MHHLDSVTKWFVVRNAEFEQPPVCGLVHNSACHCFRYRVGRKYELFAEPANCCGEWRLPGMHRNVL
jgi:hypothetical protein